MIPRFKEFIRRKKLTKKVKGKAKAPTCPANYTNATNYVNTPPYGSPPSVGGFTDSNFPGYPS
jgi:hypothetical protein